MFLSAGSVAEPEELFDRLEVMIAFNYLDSTTDLSERHWMPPGRYCWKGVRQSTGPATVLLAEAEEMGADWPPLKAGMFGGTVERFRHVVAMFSENHKELGRHFRF